MSRPQGFSKVSLQKTLKDRLVLLSNGLKEAEMGNKGIELVKEMKELHAMLEHILGEGKQASKQEAAKSTAMHISFSWGIPEEKTTDNAKSTAGEDNVTEGTFENKR